MKNSWNQSTVSVGKKGEDLVRKKLEEEGYIFITANYRFGHYEIDLIMRDNDYIVFIEVKTRTNYAFAYPREFVDRKKQLRIIAAAEHYLSDNGLTEEPVRFDVAEVYRNTGEICHIHDAFQA